MSTLLPSAPAPSPAPAGEATSPDPKALIQQQYAEVAGVTSEFTRKGVLRKAALALGKNLDVTPETAFSALLAAARAGGYPDAIEGEKLADFIRFWLHAGRTLVPESDSRGYRDRLRAAPEVLQAPAAAMAARREAPVQAAPTAVPEVAAPPEPASDAPDEPAMQQVTDTPALEPLPIIAADAVPLAPVPDASPAAAMDAPLPESEWDPILQRADAFSPEPVDWLWKHRIALGKLTLISGAPGCGKSTVALGLIAAVSTGGKCPVDGRAPLGSAILVCEEAAIRDSIAPGLMAAGADRARVGLIGDIPDQQGGQRAFDLRNDLALLERAITSRPDVRLVVIDPVNAFVAAADEREDRLGALFHPLAALAAKHRVAVVVVAHPPKGNYLKPNVQALGSAALTAAARAAFLVQRDQFDSGRIFLLQIKNALAPDRGANAFTIERREVAPGVAGAVAVWEWRRFRISAADLIGAAARNNSAKAEAHAFLHNLMADASVLPVATIEKEARAAGLLGARQPISQCKPLRDARLAFRLRVIREGFGAEGRWVWAKEDPRENQEPTEKKPKKTKKEKLAEWRARKVERRAAKAAERARARMEKRASMANAASMGNAPAPALAQGQL